MSDDLAEKIRHGDDISADELLNVFKTADPAGVLYYKMLTMVREQRSLAELPETLKKIIKTEAWKRWRWVGSTFGQNSLGAYLESPPPNGVGIKVDAVKKLVVGDAVAERMFRKAMTADKGRPSVPNASNRSIKPQHGTTRAYTLDVLAREWPDLFKQVKAKKLSANAAAIKAGFRKKPSPLEIIMKYLPKLSDEDWRQVVKARKEATQ